MSMTTRYEGAMIHDNCDIVIVSLDDKVSFCDAWRRFTDVNMALLRRGGRVSALIVAS